MTSSDLTLTKLEIAEHQLDRALQLFLDEQDFPCAITLAGASDEILGKLLEQRGEKHSLSEFTEACVQTGRIFFKEEWPTSHFVTLCNHFRDGLKHITDGQPMTITRDAAIEMIDRAIDNYWKLLGRETPRIRQFMEVAHAR